MFNKVLSDYIRYIAWNGLGSLQLFLNLENLENWFPAVKVPQRVETLELYKVETKTEYLHILM